VHVAILGAGYVGLVTGVCLAEVGHEVLVCDVDENRVSALDAGVCPIFEPGLDQLLERNITAGRLTFGTPDKSFMPREVAMVAVGTPSTSIGAADLAQVRSAIQLIRERAKPGTVIAMKSTVPPGTGRTIAPLLAEQGLLYVSNPEFLREGTAITDFFETDRVVVGADAPEAFMPMRQLYAGLDAPMVECDVTSAEMVKYASNAFLATKISFINEIASLCDRVQADVVEVARGVGLDSRIGGSFLKPGIGYGGSCFPKDTRALDFLASTNDYDFRLLKSVIEVNARQRIMPVNALVKRLGGLAGKKIAVLGLTFKAHTDDTREAPAADIIGMLCAQGARVVAHDPVGTLPSGCPAAQAGEVAEALDGADACIVTVDWPEYCSLDWARAAQRMKPGATVFDGRNCLDPARVLSAGLSYVGVGRGNARGDGARVRTAAADSAFSAEGGYAASASVVSPMVPPRDTSDLSPRSRYVRPAPSA
jgi:UDPglucose 6-dehydrogenase